MVASYQSGDLVRSFLRIPGSGSDKLAKPNIYDLGSVSPLAATVPIPQNLPPATNVLTPSPTSTINPPNQQLKRPKTPETADTHSQPITKKAKPLHQPKEPSPTITKVTMMAIRIPNAEVQTLRQQNIQLQQENENLKKQLLLFKQLIRHPERLNAVLVRLDEKINPK